MAPRRLEPAVENTARTCLYVTTVARNAGSLCAVPDSGRYLGGRRATDAVRSDFDPLDEQARPRGPGEWGRPGTHPGAGHVARGSRELDVGERNGQASRGGVRCDAWRRRASTHRSRMRGDGTWQPAHDRRRLSVARRACHGQAAAPIAGGRPCGCWPSPALSMPIAER